MKKLNRRNFLSYASLSTAASMLGQRAFGAPLVPKAPQANPLKEDVEIYQQGPDRQASWAYVGFLPRMQDPQRIRIVASVAGCTVRVSLQMNKAEVEAYAADFVKKANQMEAIRSGSSIIQWSDGIYSTPFLVLDPGIYARFQQTIQQRFVPVANRGYAANLQLLKDLFPMSVYERNDGIDFHVVFPCTPPASGPGRAKTKADYTIHILEERRTLYTKNGSHVFGGFPAFWFNGEVGFHGPIRYVTAKDDAAKLEGKDSDTGMGPDDKRIDKRWQLHRTFESHGCFRMEHVLALRHMMPADRTGKAGSQPRAQSVVITTIRDFDRLDINGDGRLELLGVQYYWITHSAGSNENAWKRQFYKGADLSSLVEFPYTDPGVIQITPVAGNTGKINQLATMARLNRLPFGED